MLAQRLEELMAEIKEHGDLSARITPDGICVTVRGTRGTRGTRETSRTYSPLMVELARLNVLTFDINKMREEIGGLVPQTLKTIQHDAQAYTRTDIAKANEAAAYRRGMEKALEIAKDHVGMYWEAYEIAAAISAEIPE